MVLVNSNTQLIFILLLTKIDSVCSTVQSTYTFVGAVVIGYF